MQIVNLAGYKFVRLDGLPALRDALRERCLALGLKGTILLSPEGINAFLAGSAAAIEAFREGLGADERLAGLRFKQSLSQARPFRRMLVKIKAEIITLRVPGLDPATRPAPALAPAQLKRWLDEGRDVVLLDTRNAFEVEAGSFRKARHLGLASFGQFPRAVDALEPELRDKTIVTFCTGGIRCEKAAPLLLARGFRDVYQLEGGILQYFEDCGAAHYEGRCFVFDERVSLDGDLQPEHRTA
ncbi:MAG TPA: rhodanese-like domain-containing protein [Burkholderiales bacterium]|nr:rhodanese-like domain-containing protein [Burkholderiales bacterium]